jgi:molybdopterin synthase sulfur carrier subunit
VIRVTLPQHLRTLARVEAEIKVVVAGAPTLGGVLDAVEAAHPVLRGTIRDQVTFRRRPLVRFYACGEDLSNEAPAVPLPDAVRRGDEPFMVVGALAGG